MNDPRTIAFRALAGTLSSLGLLGVIWLFELGALSGAATLVFGFSFAVIGLAAIADMARDL
jgi:hypothetical protein